MRKLILLLLLVFFGAKSFSQVYVGVFGGVSNYLGDLEERYYPGSLTKPALGLTASYEFSERLTLRGGLTYGKIAADDKFSSKRSLLRRNLNFESNLLEFSAIGEINGFSLYNQRWTPYAFVGLALYRYNPYTSDSVDNKIYLKPLSTEGQGLQGYDTKPYSLTQLAIPFGGGLKFQVSDNVRLSVEIGLRKLFNDYLDDVSTNYAGEEDLRAAKGQLAVDVAYRGDEVAIGNAAYPEKGAQRGSARQKDWYYFSGIHLQFRFPDGSSSYRNSSGGRGRRSNYGCPPVPY